MAGPGRGRADPARVRRAGVTAAIVIGLFGCLPTEPCACTPIVPHVTLYGTASSGGVPLAGADLVAKMFFGPACPDASEALIERLARSDSAGGYVGELPAFQPSLCFNVGAVTPPGAADTLWSNLFQLDLTRVNGQNRFRYDLSLP